MNSTKRGVVWAALTVLFAFAACSEAGEEDTIRIGVLYPTTGVGQVSGAPALMGHQMLIDRINAEGGLLGRQIVSIHRDSQSDPAIATAMARELITGEGVQFILGGLTSSEGLAISEVARQEGVIYISTIPKTTEMTKPENFHRLLFRTASNTQTEGRSAAIIMNRLGVDRVCTILFDYAYGHSLDVPFREHLLSLRPGVQIVHQSWPALGVTDYSPYITQILNSGCQAVFSGIWSSNFPAFAKQAATFGFFDRVQYVGAGETAAPEISEELGADMPVGIWGNTYEAFYFPDTPEHQRYVEELRTATGKQHTPSFQASGYIGAQFLVEGIRKAGTTETEAVVAALEGMTLMTPTGELTIRASDHQANRGEFWGKTAPSNDPAYPYQILNPVEYIPADGLMD